MARNRPVQNRTEKILETTMVPLLTVEHLEETKEERRRQQRAEEEQQQEDERRALAAKLKPELYRKLKEQHIHLPPSAIAHIDAGNWKTTSNCCFKAGYAEAAACISLNTPYKLEE